MGQVFVALDDFDGFEVISELARIEQSLGQQSMKLDFVKAFQVHRATRIVGGAYGPTIK